MTTKLKPQEKHKMSEIDVNIAKMFDIKKRLGKGAYGIVWKALDKQSNKIVAVKKIFDAFRDETDAQRTFREITFLKAFRDHPNIVTLLTVFKAINNLDMYLVFEYMESDLHNIIKKGTILKDIHKRYVMYQLINAIKYIHSGNVIHRDLKPSNILIDSKCRVKLADFGLARSVSQKPISDVDSEPVLDPLLTDYVATRWYRAPEILVASKRYTKGIDMWSLGCILGEMLRGKPLFQGTSTINQIERIVTALPEITDHDVNAVGAGFGSVLLSKQISTERRTSIPEILCSAPVDAVDLVESLLVLDPLARLTAKQALSHSYIQKFRNSISEDELSVDILPPFRDDIRLTVPEYRSKLYEIATLPTDSHDTFTTIRAKFGRSLKETKLHLNCDKAEPLRKHLRSRPITHKSEETLLPGRERQLANRIEKTHSDHHQLLTMKASKKSVISPALKRKSLKLLRPAPPPAEPKPRRRGGEDCSQYFPSRGRIHSIPSETLKEGNDIFIPDKRHSVDGGYSSLPEGNKSSPVPNNIKKPVNEANLSNRLIRTGSFLRSDAQSSVFSNMNKAKERDAPRVITNERMNRSTAGASASFHYAATTTTTNPRSNMITTTTINKGQLINTRNTKPEASSKLEATLKPENILRPEAIQIPDVTLKTRSPAATPTKAKTDIAANAKRTDRICYEERLKKLELEIEKYKNEVKSFCKQTTTQYTQKSKSNLTLNRTPVDVTELMDMQKERFKDAQKPEPAKCNPLFQKFEYRIQSTGGSGDHINNEEKLRPPMFPTLQMFGDTKHSLNSSIKSSGSSSSSQQPQQQTQQFQHRRRPIDKFH